MAFKVGIVGAGRSGVRQARRLSTYPDIEIVAVADIDRQTRDAFARAFDVALSVSEYFRLASEPDIDILYICSPPNTHHTMTINFLEAGKHVICNQPISMNTDQAEEMLALSESTGKRLFVKLPQRYDPVNQQVAKIIDLDEIGYPFLALGSCRGNDFDRLNDWHNWKGTWEQGGGGVLMQYGSEVIDLLRYFLGETAAVNAICTRFAIEPLNKAEDSCLLGMEFLEESTAEIAFTGAVRFDPVEGHDIEPALNLDLYGVEGSIRLSTSKPRLVVSNMDGCREVDESEIHTDLPTNMDRDFLDAIAEGREPLVSAEDAMIALRVVLAGYKASQMKRRVEIIEQI